MKGREGREGLRLEIREEKLLRTRVGNRDMGVTSHVLDLLLDERQPASYPPFSPMSRQGAPSSRHGGAWDQALLSHLCTINVNMIGLRL